MLPIQKPMYFGQDLEESSGWLGHQGKWFHIFCSWCHACPGSRLSRNPNFLSILSRLQSTYLTFHLTSRFPYRDGTTHQGRHQRSIHNPWWNKPKEKNREGLQGRLQKTQETHQKKISNTFKTHRKKTTHVNKKPKKSSSSQFLLHKMHGFPWHWTLDPSHPMSPTQGFVVGSPLVPPPEPKEIPWPQGHPRLKKICAAKLPWTQSTFSLVDCTDPVQIKFAW